MQNTILLNIDLVKFLVFTIFFFNIIQYPYWPFKRNKNKTRRQLGRRRQQQRANLEKKDVAIISKEKESLLVFRENLVPKKSLLSPSDRIGLLPRTLL